jgi:aspartyl-tRNA(Asn)/glutamyl-tRNA(Gln) amidotransferase subunit A
MPNFVRDPGDIERIQSDFAAGRSDPVGLVERLVQRANEAEPHVQAWLTRDTDEAMRQAQLCRDEMARGAHRGALHGIPVGVKDVIDIAGLRTRAGSLSRADCTPARLNADIVASLRAAGAVILGKTHTTEYAYFDGPPPTRNPWNVAHTPGGSSAGSAAAVSAGMAVCSIGTQTAGSVVRPAAYCGIAAFKPTTQDMSTSGMVPLSPTFDTVGWFGYRMNDVAMMSAALHPQRFKHVRSTRSLHLAMLEDPLFSNAAPAVSKNLTDISITLRDAGHDLSAVAPPSGLVELLDLHRTVLEYELSRIHGELISAPDRISAAWHDAILRGRNIADAAYFNARHALARLQSTFWDAFERYDVVLVPATADTAPQGMATGDPSYIIPFTALGGPIATIPTAVTSAGMPLGLMLCSRPGTDATLIGHALQLASAVELPRKQ